ncbi:hypothetical protein [Conexibacter woesei]|uniref:hypothetical protein n=1 Tax=Conexibacter woesei TaxID=191495 RepID=UPI0004272ECF|nr:hypothetical protein [Conexibacter woesei]
MSDVDQIPASAALVLRDRTNADPQQVFVTALYDLIALDAWTHRRVRRLPGLRLTDELTPSADAPDLPEPLRSTDAVLRRAAAELGAPLRIGTLAAWLARQAAGTPATAARRTLETLVQDGLLERRGTHLGPTARGTAVLAQHPQLPARARLEALDDGVWAQAMKSLGPLGSRLISAIADTATGQRGFAWGAIGAEVAGYGHSPNGDNRQAAIWTGSGLL